MDIKEWINKIPVGHEHPVKRPLGNPSLDRKLRAAIEQANRNGDCIINIGSGYFRPDLNDEIDGAYLAAYLTKEAAKSETMYKKHETMRQSIKKNNPESFKKWEEKYEKLICSLH